ncbi:hypothetical protein BpHYR1_033564 [Brachionus plicatilis]|uniref:Uncharacterized protein n=1 Tax=Brachionus plicatilis TaxID=10195 RepID=A0A3M7Q4H6_BRAPC|nr:hypothetical protein BpHYR1_033564 [Brachionus plicatilis]
MIQKEKNAINKLIFFPEQDHLKNLIFLKEITTVCKIEIRFFLNPGFKILNTEEELSRHLC